MKPFILNLALVGFLASSPAFAGERIVINNIYPLNQEYFQLSDSVYFMQDNQGYFEVIEGPMEEGPARCVGGGFGLQNGENSIQGVCVFGEAEDTFTMRWKAGEQGAANTWTIAGGTGKFDGMTGEGIATTGVEIMYKAMPMRQSRIVGTVNIPNN
tara:strand:+ start:3051 stop:3518 length:468 start_codon:yes stop_codon:yes gene_type:complete